MKKINLIFCCAAIALLFSTFENLNAQWQTSGNNIYYNGGNVGIGTTSIDNNYVWQKVLDIYGSAHSKLLVRSANIKTGIFSHETWSGAVGRIGTESDHDLRLMAGYGTDVMTLKTNGNVGIGTTNPASKLTVAGNVAMLGNVGIGTVNPTSKLTVVGNVAILGNVGIGLATVDNDNSWNKVLHVFGTQHAKLLVRSTNVRTGIFSHETWLGTVGRIGTETAHDLRLMVGYGTDVMTLKTNGNVGIGTTNPTSKLTVAGNISAREINVEANAGADFVFAPDYHLRPLNEVETFIKDNRHLPDIAPADSMVHNGVNMGEFQIQLLQKIEELTLYIIELEKRLSEIETK